jgi:hypothetical protein
VALQTKKAKTTYKSMLSSDGMNDSGRTASLNNNNNNNNDVAGGSKVVDKEVIPPVEDKKKASDDDDDDDEEAAMNPTAGRPPCAGAGHPATTKHTIAAHVRDAPQMDDE